jgi:hypothetical protein
MSVLLVVIWCFTSYFTYLPFDLMLFVPLLGALLAFTAYFACLYFTCFTLLYGVLDVPFYLVLYLPLLQAAASDR